MKKVLYVITAVIVLSVIMLFIFYNSGNAGTQPTLSQNDDTIKSKIGSERPVYDRLLLELDSIEIYNDSIIYGFWFQPHAAAEINLFLHKDGGFELKYCDDTIKGMFIIDGRVVRMTPHDGWSGVPIDGRLFHKHNETNFYLTDCKERELYLVKGSD